MRLQDKYADKIPNRAKYIAQDKDGDVYVYETKPYIGEMNSWWPCEEDDWLKYIAIDRECCKDWRETFEKIGPLPVPQEKTFYADLEAAAAFSSKAFLGHLVLQSLKHKDSRSMHHLNLYHDTSGCIEDSWNDTVLLELGRDSSEPLTEYLSGIGLRSRLTEYVDQQLDDIKNSTHPFADGQHAAYKNILSFIQKRGD